MRRTLALATLATLALTACESKTSEENDLKPDESTSAKTEAPAKKVAPDSEEKGPLALASFNIQMHNGPPPADGDPKPEDVEAMLKAALEGAESVRHTPGEGEEAVVTFSTRRASVPGEPDRALAVVQILTRYGGQRLDSGTSLMRELSADAPEGLSEDGPVRAPRVLLERVVQDSVRELDQHVAVIRAKDDELLRLMRDGKLLGKAAGRAVMRARELGESKKVNGAAEAIRAYLTHDRAPVVVASAGALVTLGDEGAGPSMVTAAQKLSRAMQPEAYVAFLFQMGDLGGDEVALYLASICSGHPNEETKSAACEAAENAKKKTKR